MSAFEYRLAVLTHGRMAHLDESLDSFFANVEPAPAQVLVHADGSDCRRDFLRRNPAMQLRPAPTQQGFCVATGALWAWASEPCGIPYVFWLEHDFVFNRRVDLRQLADVLDSDHQLAQMALLRGPANPIEDEAGGLIESRPGEFTARASGWLEHRSFFTTNPSLMRAQFMADNPWPVDGLAECEGRFGIGLIQRGYRFGMWGDGDAWVDHVGIRTGFGY